MNDEYNPLTRTQCFNGPNLSDIRSGELLGCPFCGELKELKEYTAEDGMADKSVRCENCGVLGPPCSTWKQAKHAWQHRVIP